MFHKQFKANIRFFCVNLYNLQRGLVNRTHAWVFSFPLEDERSRPRARDESLRDFVPYSLRKLSHNHFYLSSVKWVTKTWMENSFSVNVCIFASTCFARVKNIKGIVFCSFLHLFPFRFFPFLIIFKTGFSGYWNLIARFNIFQNWILKPNISGLQVPSPNSLTPQPQIKSNKTLETRKSNLQ